MRTLSPLFIAAVICLNCGEQNNRPHNQDARKIQKPSSELSIGAYPAKRMEEKIRKPPLGWAIVDVHGKRGKIVYLVEDQPIFTEQNIVSARQVRSGNVLVELDVIGTEVLSEYSVDDSRHNQPVGIKINDRWVSFPLLLTHIRHGSSLLGGLTEEEVQHVIETFPSQ